MLPPEHRRGPSRMSPYPIILKSLNSGMIFIYLPLHAFDYGNNAFDRFAVMNDFRQAPSAHGKRRRNAYD